MVSSQSNRERKSPGKETMDSGSTSPVTSHVAKGETEDIRVYAAISFAFLLIVVGIPLWWKTTEVYRVHIPHGQIADLKDMKVIFPIHINVVTKDRSRGDNIIKRLSTSVCTSKHGLANVVYNTETMNFDKVLKASSLQDLDALDLFPNIPGHLYLLEVPGMLRFSLSNIVVSGKRCIYFSQQTSEIVLETLVHHWLIQEEALHSTQVSLDVPTEWESDKISRRRMRPAPQYDVLFSVVHPEPERRNILWDVRHAIQEHMGKLIETLSMVTTLRAKSQWLYLVRLEGRPRQVVSTTGLWYSLPEDVLPHIITPLEKRLGSGVGQHPTIQLVLYIPPCQTSPLLITSNNPDVTPSTAFISPRWGGVQIYNPPVETCGHGDSTKDSVPYTPNSTLIMQTFKKQLKLLIGVPELVGLDGVYQLPLPPSGIRDWELDSLMRVRALEHIISARITLKSLSQLLDEISNIVINDEVGARIWQAINKSHEAINLITEGKLPAGFAASKEAFIAAEAAFSDPSLLALLYFPDDQKYAVYIPLFLPIMIPVLMSLRGIKVWWFSDKETQVDKEKCD